MRIQDARPGIRAGSRSWPCHCAPRPRPRSSGGIRWTAPLNDWVNDLAKQFNESQKDYKIVPTYKGTYAESMTAGNRGLSAPATRRTSCRCSRLAPPP